MAATTKRRRDSKPIAVIRSYRPIRIERELLAQAFDLTERGLTDGFVDAAVFQVTTDQAGVPRANALMQHGLRDQSDTHQVLAPEAVV